MRKRFRFVMVGVCAMTAGACTSLPVTPRAELSQADGGKQVGAAVGVDARGESIDGNVGAGVDRPVDQGSVADLSLPDTPATSSDSLSGGLDGGAGDIVEAVDIGSLGTAGSGGTGGTTSSAGGAGGGLSGTGGVGMGGTGGEVAMDAVADVPVASRDTPLPGADASGSVTVDTADIDVCVGNAGEGCGSCGGIVTCGGACSVTTPTGYGTSCGSCGGTITCAGTCSVTTPSNYGKSCGSCGGKYQCNGSCSVGTPLSYGTPCGCGGTITCNSTCSSTTSPTTWYQDADGDGYGNASISQTACSQPSGYVANNADCCDSDASTHPGQTDFFLSEDACGSWDWNCDGVIAKSLAAAAVAATCSTFTASASCTSASSGLDSASGRDAACGASVSTTNPHCKWVSGNACITSATHGITYQECH